MLTSVRPSVQARTPRIVTRVNLARFAARARRVKAVKASLSELADEVTRSDSEVLPLNVVKAGSGPVAYGRASARRLGVKLAARVTRAAGRRAGEASEAAPSETSEAGRDRAKLVHSPGE